MNLQIIAIIEALEQRSDRISLFPKQTWNSSLEGDIEGLINLNSSTEMITLIAALHLRNESLNTSHSYAQQIEHDATGAYWHGIMHRMEGDYANARYWFWQAGHHPVMQQVQQRVSAWLQQHWSERIDEPRSNAILQAFQNGGWNSGQFIELLQVNLNLEEDIERLLMEIQAIEIDALFQYTLAAINV